MKPKTLLIVEDETAIRDMIRYALNATSYELLEASDVPMAEKLLLTQTPNLILLDWMLPSKSGIDFIHWLKQSELWQHIPIIMLTAKAEEENKIRALNAGADDYITKPFSPLELITRIKTVLRRGPLLQTNDIIKIKDLILNTSTHQVTIQSQPLYLTANEYQLLHFFMSHIERVYSREQLLNYVWGINSDINERSVDVQIRRLRDRLKPFNYHHLINTIRGMGYKFSLQNYERQ